MRIAAIGDLHVKETGEKNFRKFFIEISQKADILVLCGDLTDHGTEVEAKMLADNLSVCTIPIVGILGNHDFASGKQSEIKKIVSSSGMKFLDNEPFILEGIGFAGVKGFGGGFKNHMLTPFGEEVLKQFVYESVNEALRLQDLLNRLKTKKKVVVMHYSPIKDTIEGENPEIFPFLGSSHLEEPINDFDVEMVFHGHSNYGKHQGKTSKGIPVYNVSLPLLEKISPKQPYALIEI